MGCSEFAYQFDLFEIASLCSNKHFTTCCFTFLR